MMNLRKTAIKLLVLSALITGSVPFAEAAESDAKNAAAEAEIVAALSKDGGAIYPIGEPLAPDHFTGKSFLYVLQNKDVRVGNVTFAPGCINHWHIHHGSCQVLAGVSGKGYYQIWGEEPQELLPGQSVTIPEGVKHWHGAQRQSWFQHIYILKEGFSTEWLEPVNPAEYAKLK